MTESKADCYLGQCRTGFLKGQKSATVVSHVTALTGRKRHKSKKKTFTFSVPKKHVIVEVLVFQKKKKMFICFLPGTDSTLKEFALLFFL